MSGRLQIDWRKVTCTTLGYESLQLNLCENFQLQIQIDSYGFDNFPPLSHFINYLKKYRV